MFRYVCWLFVAGLMPLLASAQKKPGEAASLGGVEIKGEPKPGAEVTAVVKVRLEKGFHTHSNKPSEPQFIATVLNVPPAAGVKAGTIQYPKGRTEKVEGLAKPLSVYEKEFELSVPIKLAADVTLPVAIPAALRYQACQGATCYPPRILKFDITVPAAK